MARPYYALHSDSDDDGRPEWTFVAALLRLAIADAASDEPARREDVARWLRVGGVAYWSDLLGLGDGFVEAFTAALEARLHPPPRGRP
jgi:hypothetical protein